ncbi:MAG TPA: DUF1800 domain-containing protein, partial [Candidatus Binataceae bacterium]
MSQTGDMPRQDRALHVLNRLAFGPRPGDIERVRSIGAEQFVHEQLHPEAIEIPDQLVDKVRSYRTLHMTPLALFMEFQRPIAAARASDANKSDAVKEARMRSRVVMREAVEARLIRAIEGPRQLQEVMTAFWFNHFNIFAGKGLDHIWTGAFEEQAIRPHTMGRFRDLLGATARHPAMLFYLDNWQNTAAGSPGAKGKFEGINENYARELMELHTLGVNGGYTQNDVIALAHILTGWGIARQGGRNGRRGPRSGFGPGSGPFGLRPRFAAQRGSGADMATRVDPSLFYFDSRRHDYGSKTLLGHTFEGSGESEGERALDLLARHRSTANRLSYQLARYFVADEPPKALVQRMSQRYLGADGNIRTVLTTMFESPEFWDRSCYGAKFKTPY